MEEEAAKRLINKTLNKSFNKDQFTYFIKNLFNTIEGPTFTYRGNYIPKAYQEYIKTLSRVGKYTGPDENKVDILVVQLEKETSLERARTMQRNFIAWYLNGSRGDVLKDAALVAFVAPNQEDWRLSLVKMAYDLKQTEEGKVKIAKELTPARRWSFLVGTQENTHTVRKQLLPLLVREDGISLSDFEKAFDIEVVTKRFFKKYRELFHRVQEALDEIVEANGTVREEFEKKNVSTIDFAKKLLGQIVFLYFLQKKGWFGVDRDAQWGTGPKNFLRLLFEKKLADYENFFNDILEPLFYEALAVERPDDYYSRFNCKIPFLNGGLFDPIYNYDWVHTDILLPNELFSNQEKTEEGDTGTGILDVFDRYNFTVKEDEPLEKEVAVDPEMLGKVFENLLEVKDRKSKGTYYTPREIVHYMCQESLINYLATELDGKVGKEDIRKLIDYGETVVEHERQVENQGEETETYFYKLPRSIRDNAKLIDKKLAEIKVCDPAVGSGAFPVGMMNEVVRARHALTTHLDDKENRTIYKFKRHAIQNSLYGVDIDPGAVEIAKLRLWLSLVVDEEDRHTINPLPNLDYKIMQGNSLLEEYEGIKLIDRKFFEKQDSKEKKINSLKERQSKLQREYIELHSQDKLNKARKVELERKLKNLETRIKNLRKEGNSNNVRPDDLFSVESKARKKAKKLQRKQTEFFRAAHKNEKDRLKKEIENITWDLIEATLKEQDAEDKLEEVEQFKKSNTKPFFLWHLNFSEVFEEKGGFDVVIANPPYINIYEINPDHKPYYKEQFCTAYKKYDIYILFFELGFNILRKSGVLCFISSNKYFSQPYGVKLRRLLLDNNVQEIVNFRTSVFEATVDTAITLSTKEKDEKNKIRVREIKDQEGLKHLRRTPYKEVPLHFIKTLPDQSFRLRLNREKIEVLKKLNLRSFHLEKICYVNYGCRLVSKVNEKIKDDYIFEEKSSRHLRSFIEGKDISRYIITTHRWVDYTPDEHYLPLFPELFESQKLVAKDIVGQSGLQVALDNLGYYNDHTVVNAVNWFLLEEVNYKNVQKQITQEKINSSRKYSQKFLLGLLNSKLINFYFYELYNIDLHFYPSTFQKMLVPRCSKNQQKPIMEIVEKILAQLKSSKDPETSNLKLSSFEEEIDQMVYDLYGLTSEEIEIVKDSANDQF